VNTEGNKFIKVNDMATASDDATDLQTYPICLEILKTPKNLPCLHTFCEKCIGTYITSLLDRDKNQSTECPVCKSVFVIPEGLCVVIQTVKFNVFIFVFRAITFKF
jgi:hypothetical protein